MDNNENKAKKQNDIILRIAMLVLVGSVSAIFVMKADSLFEKLGEIFYLLPYLFIAGIVAVALVFMVRSIGINSIKTNAGFTSRVVLTIIAFALVAVVWYYFTPENLEKEQYSTWARVIAVVCYLSALTDIWCEKKTEG